MEVKSRDLGEKEKMDGKEAKTSGGDGKDGGEKETGQKKL